MNNDNALTGVGENVSSRLQDLDRNMELLRNRMDALEEVSVLAPEIPRTSATVKPFVIQIENNNMCCTLYHIITSSKFAALQFLWLLVCLFPFLYYASVQFYVALENEREEMKPEKLLYVEDYGAEDSSHTMPYIYITFWVEVYDNYDSLEEIANGILAELKYRQQFNKTAIIKYHTQNGINNVTGIIEEVEVGYIGAYAYGFRGYFRLKLLPPIPGSVWTFNMRLMYWWSTWNYWVRSYYISVDFRTSGFYSRYPGAIWVYPQYDKWLLYLIGYKERVTHTLENENIRTIENELVTWYEIPDAKNGFWVELLPDFNIEHWGEYLQYGFWDWVGAMGGIFSLLSVVYFVVAKRIAVYSGSLDLGILPAMSDVFRNQEDIGIMKRKLQEGRYPVRVLDTNLITSGL